MEFFPTLLTLHEMSQKLCPLLRGPCQPKTCNLLAWSKMVHRDSGERLVFCGLRGTQGGLWHPRAGVKIKPHAHASRADAPVHVARAREKNSTVVPMPPKPSKTPPTTESPTDGEII